MSEGRSLWTIDCRKFTDPDNDRSLRKHIVMKSILESENYQPLHSNLYDAMSRILSSKNIVIMICRSGRHRSVANAELWSNTLTRCGPHRHSVSLLQLSELDFWENKCAGNWSECSKQSLRVFQTHHDQVQAVCLRRVLVSDPCTGRWKRSRQEHAEGSAQPAKDPLGEEDHLPQTSKKRATSATAFPAETNPSRGILDELAERLGNFHDSAPASCPRNRNVSRTTDQSMVEAAKWYVPRIAGISERRFGTSDAATTRKSLL